MRDVYYGEIYDQETIGQIGLLLSKFRDKMISYKEFVQAMLDLGHEVEVDYIDSTRLYTMKSYNEFKKRVSNQTSDYEDISKFYIVISDNCRLYFCYDRTMIEALAKIGDEQAMETLDYLQKWEKAHSKGAIK